MPPPPPPCTHLKGAPALQLAAMDDETVEDYLSYYPLHTAAGKEGGEAGSA